MAEVELAIAGRTYRVACRDGEEPQLQAAATLVDGKSREALAGLGTLSEARQLLFASLLLADQLIEKRSADPSARLEDPRMPEVDALATRLERLATALEQGASTP
ncbi:MAG: cell division protein ZapA [Sphingomicrobium sp.]